MVYQLEISHTAHKQILRLPIRTRERINSSIAKLSENPRSMGVKKLTPGEGYRVRVGDYRILYTINDADMKVIIYRVMSRGDVYKL